MLYTITCTTRIKSINNSKIHKKAQKSKMREGRKRRKRGGREDRQTEGKKEGMNKDRKKREKKANFISEVVLDVYS